jgi:hypothetical protein
MAARVSKRKGTKTPTKTPKERLIVNVVREADGYTFALTPESAKRVHELNPEVALPARSFVAFDVKDVFAAIRGHVVDHVVPLLTGLAPTKLKELGDVWFYDPWNDRDLGPWRPAHP